MVNSESGLRNDLPLHDPKAPDLDALKRDATIFVVEDDSAGREALQASLTTRGFRVQAFASAELFLANADLRSPGCVVTDFRMPGLSGTDLQLALNERQSLLAVIVVSGYADIQVAVRAMQQGAITLLEKPYDNAELLSVIDQGLRLNAMHRARAKAADRVERCIEDLNETQRMIMNQLVCGKSNKAIASELSMGLRTVERHRRLILERMHVDSLPELAALLATAGIRDADSGN